MGVESSSSEYQGNHRIDNADPIDLLLSLLTLRRLEMIYLEQITQLKLKLP